MTVLCPVVISFTLTGEPLTSSTLISGFLRASRSGVATTLRTAYINQSTFGAVNNII